MAAINQVNTNQMNLHPIQTAVKAPQKNQDNTKTTEFSRAVEIPNEEREKERQVARENVNSNNSKQPVENLVSVSDDGDTVQVSRESETRLEDAQTSQVVIKQEREALNQADQANWTNPSDHAEFMKPEEEDFALEKEQEEEEMQEELAPSITEQRVENAKKTEAREEMREEAIEASEARTAPSQNGSVSYTGVSDSELERMYLTGEISRLDYDQEMEAREEQEEAQAAENSQTQEQFRTALEAGTEVEMTEETMAGAYGQESSDTIPASARVAAMQALQDFPFNVTG